MQFLSDSSENMLGDVSKLNALVDQHNQQINHQILRKTLANLMDYNQFNSLSQYLLEKPDITYASFQQLRLSLPEHHRSYFTAKVFMACKPDPKTFSISSEKFVKYIDYDIELKRVLYDLLTLSLSNPDPSYLTPEQLQSYILTRIPDLDPHHQMVPSFYEFYACSMVQRFLFYIDTRNRNKISINEIIRSSVLKDLLEFLHLQQELVRLVEEQERLEKIGVEDERINEEVYILRDKVESSWFCGNNAVTIYTTFLNLDADQNGLLSLDEVMAFNGFHPAGLHLTRAAWRRIFEELVVFAPFELDYRGFVTLVLALEDINMAEEIEKGGEGTDGTDIAGKLFSGRSNKGMPGIRFFWNIIDFNRSGFLSPMKIKFFYADIEEYMALANQVIPAAHIMVTEVYDMLGYHTHDNHGEVDDDGDKSHKVPGPSYKHLIKSKRFVTMLMMLLDINSFWRYENRESQNASPTPPPPIFSPDPSSPEKVVSPIKEDTMVKTGKSLEDDEDDDRQSGQFDTYDAEDSLDAVASTLLSSSSIMNKKKTMVFKPATVAPVPSDTSKAKELILKQSSLVYDDEGDDEDYAYDF